MLVLKKDTFLVYLLASRFGLSLSDNPFLSSEVLSGTALSHLVLANKASLTDEFLLNGTMFLDVLLQNRKK